MSDRHDLGLYVVPPGQGASFTAMPRGGLILVKPLKRAARERLENHVGDEVSWYEDQLVVEPRYFPDLADAIIEAGMFFEGDDSLTSTSH